MSDIKTERCPACDGLGRLPAKDSGIYSQEALRAALLARAGDEQAAAERAARRKARREQDAA
jgi:hypothetical protein